MKKTKQQIIEEKIQDILVEFRNEEISILDAVIKLRILFRSLKQSKTK